MVTDGVAPPVRRVVITGVGLVSPLGNDLESTWSNLLAGVSGAGPITRFQTTEEYACRIACELRDFDPLAYFAKKELRRHDPYSIYGIAAAAQAIEASDLERDLSKLDPTRVGVIMGTGIGGITTHEAQHTRLLKGGPRRVSPFFIPLFIPDMCSGLVAMRWNLQGPNYATVSACASGAHAIGDATRHIRHGDAEVMIAGGAEATITPLAVAGFSSMRALSTRNDDAERASRPFSHDRDGFVMGEGAGALVLESLEHARERGARVLAEIVGYGSSADAFHITAPPPDGYGAVSAMRAALANAGANPADVDYVNSHGTSTMADSIETSAIKQVLGDHAYEIVVGSTKSMTGHLLGAAGALEAIVCIQVCRNGIIPPTINFSGPDPECDLDYAFEGAVERDVELTLTNSFGFGGHNVCLAIRRWDD